ncbi:MAG: xylose isomerase [Synergistaceae bacterium]|jgi:xylose isomerase|nr:xylose isomerase [Synergistaceae bacterium]
MAEYFKGIGQVKYEGSTSKNPLAFKHYNADEKVGDKTMKEHLRFAVAWWHTFSALGADMFGDGTLERPWLAAADPVQQAKDMADAAFEFMDKIGIDYFCFHDRDLVAEAPSLKETNERLDEIAAYIKDKMKASGKKLLWGTSNLTGNSRFMHGAATNPNAEVFAFAAAKVQKALSITKDLNGEGYVFWGGREGYETLLNTDMGLELGNLARFLGLAVGYADKIGFKGHFYIEPKPKEPTKHQYDFDVAAGYAFLQKYGLLNKFKFNIETNHATLAGHTVQHELHYARVNGILGSVDANQGDMLLGWYTDIFPTDVYGTTMMMIEILRNGGLPGGLNFDAKVRRGSFKTDDLFYGHIAGMDCFAKSLKAAHGLLESRELDDFLEKRYESWKTGVGAEIVQGKATLEGLAEYALAHDSPKSESGRQELLESIVMRYLYA